MDSEFKTRKVALRYVSSRNSSVGTVMTENGLKNRIETLFSQKPLIVYIIKK